MADNYQSLGFYSYRKDTTPHVTIALVNGEKVEYQRASKDIDGYAKWKDHEAEYEYIGKGSIYSINGVVQTGFNNLHFWKLKT